MDIGETSYIHFQGSAAAGSAMDRLNVGMQVEIKRSDGRVHGAVVTGVNHATGGVNVEWFEKVSSFVQNNLYMNVQSNLRIWVIAF